MLTFLERLGAYRLGLEDFPRPLEPGDLLLELRGRALHAGSASSRLVAETDLNPSLHADSPDASLALRLAGADPGGDGFVEIVEEALGIEGKLDVRELLFRCAEEEQIRYQRSTIPPMVALGALWVIGDAWAFPEEPPSWIDASRGLAIVVAEGGDDAPGAREIALDLLSNLEIR